MSTLDKKIKMTKPEKKIIIWEGDNAISNGMAHRFPVGGYLFVCETKDKAIWFSLGYTIGEALRHSILQNEAGILNPTTNQLLDMIPRESLETYA